MADYDVPHRHVGVHEKQLVAGQTDRVFFRAGGGTKSAAGWGNPIKQVEIMTDGVADIYVTLGEQQAPEVQGTMSWRIPSYAGSSVLTVQPSMFSPGGDLQVNLISTGAPTYSVSRT